MKQVFGIIAIFMLAAAPAMAQGARDFHADMAAEWETKYTESPGVGTADFHLDLTDLTFTWNITFKDLSGPLVTAAVYGPAQPGANGIVQLTLAGKGAKSPVEGTAILNSAQAEYMLSGWTYVDIATTRFPRGEIRNQMKVQHPQDSDR